MKEGKFILELKVYFYKGSVKLGPRWLMWRMDTIHLWRMLLWTHLVRSMPWSPMSSLMVARYIDDCIVLTNQEIHIINVQMMRIQRYDQCGEYIDGFDVQERLVIKRFNHNILHFIELLIFITTLPPQLISHELTLADGNSLWSWHNTTAPVVERSV